MDDATPATRPTIQVSTKAMTMLAYYADLLVMRSSGVRSGERPAASHFAEGSGFVVSFLCFMKEVSSSNFGLLIAFLLPGFMVLWGASYFSETVKHWLSGSNASAPTVGGFMYVTLASVAAGVTASTVRWAVIDTIHHWTGLPRPRWDFFRLRDNVGAYNLLNDNHYRFYQFHGNALIALLFVYVARRVDEGVFTARVGWFDLGFAILSVILFVGSRDTLRKYYVRVSQLLGDGTPEHRCDPMLYFGPRLRSSSSMSDATRIGSPHNSPAQRSFKN